MAMLCPNCGYEVRNGKFCSHCGFEIKSEMRGKEKTRCRDTSLRKDADNRGAGQADKSAGEFENRLKELSRQEGMRGLSAFQWISLMLSVVFCIAFAGYTGFALYEMRGAVYDLEYQIAEYGASYLVVFALLAISFMAIPITLACRSVRVMVSKRAGSLDWMGLSIESGSLVVVCLVLQFILEPGFPMITSTVGSAGEGIYLFMVFIWDQISFFAIPAVCVCVLMLVQAFKSRAVRTV